MDARMTLVAMALVSSAALAAPPRAQTEAAAKAADARPPDIVVVDDVGVGDHFPSHVPGTAPWRLPPREAVAPSEAPERPASEPGEWATIPSSPAASAPPQPQPAAPQPPQSVAQAPAPAEPIAADLERETLDRASNSLLSGNCETELPRLAELLERTDSAGIKARVRILRARCFTQRAKPERAKAEYLLYLRDFPGGPSTDEAKDAALAQ